MKLLETTISKITVPAGKRDILVFDDALPGFGIRKFDSGKASFFVKYNIGRQQRKLTLGPVLPGTLANMRKAAADVLAKARLGDDVQAAKKATRERDAVTVGTLIERYLKGRTDVRPRYRVELERHLLRNWAPIHRLPVENLTRRLLVDRIDELVETSGRTAADRAKVSIATFLGWCVERSYLEANPALGIRRREVNGARDRVLSDQELAAIWKACRDDEYGAIIKLLALTGQRRDEIGSLHWSEVNEGRKQIELPGERTKNGRTHAVPLSAPALAVLESVPHKLDRDLIFGFGAGGFSGWSKAKARLDVRLGDEVKPWRLHDLRRSFATLSAEHGLAAPHAIEAVLNHQSGSKSGVVGIYNRAGYEQEKRQLLETWAAHLMRLVESE